MQTFEKFIDSSWVSPYKQRMLQAGEEIIAKEDSSLYLTLNILSGIQF